MICDVCSTLTETLVPRTHLGKSVHACERCVNKPLCKDNPDGPHGEVITQDHERWDPEKMEIGPLPPDRPFGYCENCLQPWEWDFRHMEWVPLTWQRLAYLWAEQSGMASLSSETEAIDVVVSSVDSGFLGYGVGEVSITFVEIHGHRQWRLSLSPPFDPQSELLQLARAAGYREGDEFEVESLRGVKCKVEIGEQGSIVRIL